MLQHTETAIRAILAADPSVTPEQAKAAINAAKGAEASASSDIRKTDAILTVAEVAGILHTTKRSVSRYATLGAIRRVRVPGMSRAVGYSAESVRAFLAGKPQGKAVA